MIKSKSKPHLLEHFGLFKCSLAPCAIGSKTYNSHLIAVQLLFLSDQALKKLWETNPFYSHTHIKKIYIYIMWGYFSDTEMWIEYQFISQRPFGKKIVIQFKKNGSMEYSKLSPCERSE